MTHYFQIKWESHLLTIILSTEFTIQDQRRTRIRALNAVAQFRASKFDAAIDTFIELDFNPAKVVALYPESVSGRLSVPQEGWIPLYGGPSEEDHALSEGLQESDKDISSQEKPIDNLASGTGSVGGRLRKTGLGMFMPSLDKDDDSASVRAARQPLHGVFSRLPPYKIKSGTKLRQMTSAHR
jgi:hypothetical protein